MWIKAANNPERRYIYFGVNLLKNSSSETNVAFNTFYTLI